MIGSIGRLQAEGEEMFVRIGIVVVALVTMMSAPRADAVADFYRGKSVQLVLG